MVGFYDRIEEVSKHFVRVMTSSVHSHARVKIFAAREHSLLESESMSVLLVV